MTASLELKPTYQAMQLMKNIQLDHVVLLVSWDTVRRVDQALGVTFRDL